MSSFIARDLESKVEGLAQWNWAGEGRKANR